VISDNPVVNEGRGKMDEGISPKVRGPKSEVWVISDNPVVNEGRGKMDEGHHSALISDIRGKQIVYKTASSRPERYLYRFYISSGIKILRLRSG
jgi:hypothetical protein